MTSNQAIYYVYAVFSKFCFCLVIYNRKFCLQIACKWLLFANIVMGLNIKLLLDKRRIKDNNTYPLVMRIIYNRKPINVPVGYSLLEKEWDSDRERIKASSKVSDDITRLNNLIHKKRTKAYDLMTKLADDGKLSRGLIGLNEVCVSETEAWR